MPQFPVLRPLGDAGIFTREGSLRRSIGNSNISQIESYGSFYDGDVKFYFQ